MRQADQKGPDSVLLVEDDTRIRRAFAAVMRRQGLIVHEEGQAEGALNAIASCRFQLVLIDYFLPDATAECFLENTSALDVPPLIVVMSGSLSFEVAMTSLRAGVAAVPKPVTADDIMSVYEVLRQQRRSSVELYAHEFGLSERQTEILQRTIAGFNQAEIADALGISLKSLYTYWHRIYEKTGERGCSAVLASIVRKQLR